MSHRFTVCTTIQGRIAVLGICTGVLFLLRDLFSGSFDEARKRLDCCEFDEQNSVTEERLLKDCRGAIRAVSSPAHCDVH
jgi:hypothetical protein